MKKQQTKRPLPPMKPPRNPIVKCFKYAKMRVDRCRAKLNNAQSVTIRDNMRNGKRFRMDVERSLAVLERALIMLNNKDFAEEAEKIVPGIESEITALLDFLHNANGENNNAQKTTTEKQGKPGVSSEGDRENLEENRKVGKGKKGSTGKKKQK